MTKLTTGSQPMLRVLAGAGLLLLAAGCTTETYADRFARTGAGTQLAKPLATSPGSATIGRGSQATSPSGALQGPGAAYGTRSPWANPRLAGPTTPAPDGQAMASAGLGGALPTGAPRPLSPGEATGGQATGDDAPGASGSSGGMRIWIAPDAFAEAAEDTAAPAPDSAESDSTKGDTAKGDGDEGDGGEGDGDGRRGAEAKAPGVATPLRPDAPAPPAEARERPALAGPTAPSDDGIPDRTAPADDDTEPLPLARQRLAQPGPTRP